MPSFSSIIIALVGASTAVMALPQIAGLGNSASAGSGGSCATGNKEACCDTKSDSGLLGNVFGGSCLVPNLISVSNTCPGENTYCCPVDQSGTLDLAIPCIPIQA